MFRRPTQAAGRSWRKWEDPVIYRRPWLPDLAFWVLCAAVGAVLGLEAR